MSEKEEDMKDFNDHLAEAQNTDLSDIEDTGCVSIGRDFKENFMIIMIPVLGLNRNEKPEVMFRRMLLLFIRKANELVGNPYSVIYAHTSIDILNQYPLIYKFYSILPRSYKKNIQNMYIIHPNSGIKMFFEFARVFLSHKFYNKLCLFETILEFQKEVPPTVLNFPLKFYKIEDDNRGLKYHGSMPPLDKTFEKKYGTSHILYYCAEYLKKHGGLTQSGIFRIPGDDAELNLSKVRLQYHLDPLEEDINSYPCRIQISENDKYLVIGNLRHLYKASDSNSSDKKSSKKSKSGDHSVPFETPTSVILITNINTVAQIFKLAIRDLPEPIISPDVYNQLIDVTNRYQKTGLNIEWENQVSHSLAQLPFENLSTIIYSINFLREVAHEWTTNNMDSYNLSRVFAPTLFRQDMEDPMKALMEINLSQIVIKEIIERKHLLSKAMKKYNEIQRQLGQPEQQFVFESSSLDLKGHYTQDGYTRNELNGISEITQGMSGAMLGRVFRGGRSPIHSSNLSKETDRNSNDSPNKLEEDTES